MGATTANNTMADHTPRKARKASRIIFKLILLIIE
jgi:hypothetical protein